jgi:hypothetical protein
VRFPLRKKTITGWAIACVVYLGLLGYEWMPSHFRGGWVFLILLVISGAFIEIGTALIVGLLAFVGASLYMLYKLKLGLPAERQVLMMFLSPIAPLWLSAIQYNLQLRRDAAIKALALKQGSAKGVLNTDHYDDFVTRLDALCRSCNIKGYAESQIDIVNRELIAELLGSRTWVDTQNRIVRILNVSANQPIFYFVNDALDMILCIDLSRSEEAEGEPDYIAQLRQIAELNLDVNVSWRIVPDGPTPAFA